MTNAPLDTFLDLAPKVRAALRSSLRDDGHHDMLVLLNSLPTPARTSIEAAVQMSAVLDGHPGNSIDGAYKVEREDQFVRTATVWGAYATTAGDLFYSREHRRALLEAEIAPLEMSIKDADRAYSLILQSIASISA
jgi:hypothetical protein